MICTRAFGTVTNGGYRRASRGFGNVWRGGLTSSTSEDPHMKMMAGSRLVCLSTLLLLLRPAIAQSQATLPSEMPAKFEPVTDSFDYIKRDVMIPSAMASNSTRSS